jgi:predicted transcriptional regulator
VVISSRRRPDNTDDPDDPADGGKGRSWTFLTNHARVLIAIVRDPKIRVRDLAGYIGITERATQLIVADLEEAGYLTHTRVGRRNRYTVRTDRPFRHPAEADYDVRALIAIFTQTPQ